MVYCYTIMDFETDKTFTCRSKESDDYKFLEEKGYSDEERYIILDKCRIENEYE